jgi:alcohol dehydrogenase
VIFGIEETARLPALLEELQIKNPALICGKHVLGTSFAQNFCETFCEIQPNPTKENRDRCAAFLCEAHADGVVALGGGSVLDCAKAAAEGLPLIALPTTAGTGSEVTNIAVLTDGGRKTPQAKYDYFPKIAIVDPVLSLTCPAKVTAESGMDALSHAVESLWSKGHRPPCDALAAKAIGLILANIKTAYDDGGNLAARAAMSEGALLAGLAFSQTRTAAVHACSFPLTVRYGLSHGAACAFTLAAFARVNANEHLHGIAKTLDFVDFFAFANEIDRLNDSLGLPRTLKEAGIPKEDLPLLAQACLLPANMQNNPVTLTAADIQTLLERLE